MSEGMVTFHGGCIGCTQQQDTCSTDICNGCQYFMAEWHLPNLNNEPLDETDKERAKILARMRGKSEKYWLGFLMKRKKA